MVWRYRTELSPPQIRKSTDSKGYELECRIYTPDGRMRRVHKRVRSRADAMREYTLIQAATSMDKLATRDGNTRGKYTLSDAATRYQEVASLTQSPNTVRCEYDWITQLVGFFGKKRQLRSIEANDIRSYIKHRGDKIRSCVGELGVLRRIFKRAIEDELADFNPVIGVKMPRQKQPPIYYLTKDETRAVLDMAAAMYAESENDFASYRHMMLPYVTLSIYTGARPCELRRMEWRDIDMKESLVLIRATKTETNRTVMLSNDALNALKSWKSWLKSMGVTGDKRVFPPYLHGGELVVRKPIEELFRRALGRNEKPYILRHTFATLIVLQGVPANVAQRLLGHSSLAMTTRYTRIKDGAETAAICAIETALTDKVYTKFTPEEKSERKKQSKEKPANTDVKRV